MGHVRKNLSAGFWTFASYRAWFIKQNLVTVFYLIDFALYDAKVQYPLRFFLTWHILLLMHVWNRSNRNFA